MKNLLQADLAIKANHSIGMRTKNSEIENFCFQNLNFKRT